MKELTEYIDDLLETSEDEEEKKNWVTEMADVYYANRDALENIHEITPTAEKEFEIFREGYKAAPRSDLRAKFWLKKVTDLRFLNGLLIDEKIDFDEWQRLNEEFLDEDDDD